MPILRKADLSPDPILQFASWFEAAKAADLPLPSAMTLATATANGIPSARMVLLRHFDRNGFVFFTNYDSQKGRELGSNPVAALVFYWSQLGRQVRITGPVFRVRPEESDAYFQGRPRGSQLGAWASPQSQVLPGRTTISDNLDAVNESFIAKEITRPSNWGGYRVSPVSIEFWQDQPDRLHDRLRYRKDEKTGWIIERLAP
jgi:pyridoxamine 5'-phosphate oxidase